MILSVKSQTKLVAVVMVDGSWSPSSGVGPCLNSRGYSRSNVAISCVCRPESGFYGISSFVPALTPFGPRCGAHKEDSWTPAVYCPVFNNLNWGNYADIHKQRSLRSYIYH